MFVSDKARKLFAQAQTLDLEGRDQFVTNACANDAELLQEVSSLLKASDDSLAFFDQLSDRISLASLAENDDSAHHGKMAGNWRLGECIGRGGMGSVFVAERADDEYEKQAAVKLLPLGMDSESARERFAQERQILARLVHENIARLLDGGVTDDGVPFFAMDFVDGIAIDDYCETNNLDVDARLHLVLEVCDAVQYAHSALVVHRDLKPGNILVDKDGCVRLLDFGIARLLEPVATDEPTHYAQRPVTPVFASPEMLRGETVDVTTDVYSIGVLLYLLLTKHIPLSYEGLSAAEVMERAGSVSPVRADSINPHLDTDVAVVIDKALSRSPQDRYLTVDQLATDLRNYLAGRPVTAKAPTRWYHAWKFLQRNAAQVGALSVAVIALAATAVVAMLQSQEASRQRDLALLGQQRLQASNEFYSLLLEEMGDRPFTTVELLDRGRSMLEQQYGLDRPFMGHILYDVSRNYSRLQESEKVLELLLQAETLARQTGDNDLLAMVSCRLAGAYASLDPALAREYSVSGRTIYESLAPPRIEATLDCTRMFAKESRRSGDTDAALSYLLQAKAALDSYPGQAANLRGPLLNELSHIYFSRHEFDKSIMQLDEILAILDASGRGNSLGYSSVASNKAVALSAAGMIDEALATWEQLVERLRASGYGQRGASSVLSRYARTLGRVGRMAESEAIHREAIEAARAVGDEEGIATNQVGLARVHLANKDYASAHEHLDEAQSYLLRNEYGDSVLVGSTKVLRIQAWRGQEKFDQALEAVTTELDAIGYPEVMHSDMLDSYLIQATSIYHEMGQLTDAVAFATVVIGQMEKRAVGDPLENIDVARAYVHRAEILESSGDTKAAIADLELSIPVLSRVFGADHKESVSAQSLLRELRQE